MILLWISLVLVPVCLAQETAMPSSTTTREATYPTAETPLMDNVDSSLERAQAWLSTQRAQDWGWHNDTPLVTLALQLSNGAGVHGEDALSMTSGSLETQLSAKQMEVEILILLWRHHEVPVSSARLAQYTMALNSLCQDPRQFHSHDLIGAVQHHEPQKDYEFAFSTLAACSSNAHVRKRQIRRLLDIANAANDHNIDTVAMVILALRCIVKDHRHRNLHHFVRRPSIGLARQQQSDGSFGGLRATTLAMQALQDATELTDYWNRTAALTWILARQNTDGNFGNVASTADVVLALSTRGLSAVRDLDCGHSYPDSGLENHVELDGVTKFSATHGNDSDARNVTVSYTLWVGTNITENYTVIITAPRNISFFNVMQMAADMDSHFVFQASEWPNGHYVHTLAGHKEEPMGYHYWLLYRLPELPDPLSPPANQLVAPVGVDGLVIEDGDHYLFWYKKL